MATRRDGFHRTVGWLLALLCAALLCAACGDDDTGGGDAGTDTDTDSDTDSDTDTGSDTDTDTTGTDSVSFVVLNYLRDDPMWEPLPGATVAFDAPGGARIEQTTDADGKVTFTGFDWAEGTATVTAYSSGFVPQTLANIDATTATDHSFPAVDGNLAISLFDRAAWNESHQLVEVSGTLTGMQDAAAHVLLLNIVEAAYGGSQVNASDDGTFTMDVPANRPFSLQAFEMEGTPPTHEGYTQTLYQVASVHFDGLDAGVEDIAIDFANDGLTTQTVDTSVTLPTRAESPVRSAIVVCGVPDPFSLYWIGWATSVAIAEDGNSYDATLEWWEPDWSEHPMMGCWAQTESGRVQSQTLRPGTPEAVPIGALPDMPDWITPPGTEAHPLHDPIEWSYNETPPEIAWLHIYRDNANAWSILADPDTTTLTIPALPSNADEAEILGTSSLLADLALFNGFDLDTNWPETGAWSSQILVQP